MHRAERVAVQPPTANTCPDHAGEGRITTLSPESSADVAVIGGGLIGLSVAWRLAAARLSVTLVDPGERRGASHVSAGMLAPVAEAQFGERDLLALNLESWRRYPRFIAELEEATGAWTGYAQCGSLLVARDSDDNASLERDFQYRVRLGLDVERLSAAECRRLEPRLAPSVRGGVLARGDHQVDPRRLCAALEAACIHAGVRIVRGSASLLLTRNRVAGINMGDMSTACDTVVVAAGCWSGSIAGIPVGAVPRVHPVKGQVVRLMAPPGQALVQHVIRGPDVYVVPRREGEIVVGATVEERGYDTTVTAGAVYALLRDARELIPDVAEAQFAESSAGLRPATADNAPLIGATEIQGLVLATGHYRNGVLLTPITADAVVALCATGALPEPAAPFTPLRFSGRVEVPA